MRPIEERQLADSIVKELVAAGWGRVAAQEVVDVGLHATNRALDVIINVSAACPNNSARTQAAAIALGLFLSNSGHWIETITEGLDGQVVEFNLTKPSL